MLQSPPCILIAGNDADTLISIQQLIIKQQKIIDIITCTPVDILQHVHNYKPVMVLFCLNPEKKTATANIKRLRDDKAFDDIPMYIYTNVPTEEDIRTLLKKVSPIP